MKTRIVRIGNSRGVRIPKLLLEQSELEGEVEMKAENGTLTIGPVAKARAGWADAFRLEKPRARATGGENIKPSHTMAEFRRQLIAVAFNSCGPPNLPPGPLLSSAPLKRHHFQRENLGVLQTKGGKQCHAERTSRLQQIIPNSGRSQRPA